MTMTITEAERATSHHHHHHHHRTSGSELFVCFTSRGSSSSSSSASMMKLASSSSSSAKASILSPGRSDKLREAPASRRLKASGSIKGQSSPMLFATGKKRNGSGFETQEPTSPKVTCIGQVRVKTKQGKKKMRVGRGGEASSFSKREHHPHEECLPHRTQRWSHIFCFKKEISFSICEAIREFTCFLPCTSGGDGGGHGERSSATSPAAVRDDGKERDGVSTACGAVFAKWLMVLQDGDEKRLREEVPLTGDGRAASAAQAVVVLQDEEEEIGGKCTRAEEEMGREMEACFKESNKEEKGDEEEEEKIVVPPKNALLLMRCRSDPVRMAALASRFWESPVVARPHVEDEEEDEEEDDEEDDEEEEEDYEDVVEERKDDEAEGMLDRMEEEDEIMTLAKEERETNEEEEEEEEVEEEEEDADVFVDLETQEENELKGEVDEEREDGEKEIEEEKEEGEQEKEKEEDLVIVEEEKGELNVVIQEISSEAKEEDGGQLLDKIEPSEVLLEERKDEGEETEVEKENPGEELSQISVSPESEDEAPVTSLEKEEQCKDHPLDKEEPRQSTGQREEQKKKETGDFHQAVSVLAHQEEAAADKGGEEQEEDKYPSNKLQLQEFRGDEKKRERKEARKREAKRDEEKEEGEAPLPDCLLLMMYEPKLSMEVSKETWVCSRDFVWHRPRRQDRKKQQDKGAEEEKTKKQEERETKKRVSFEERPQKKSPSMAKLIEQKLVNAYEPFVLTRCKSEPMRSTSSVSLVPETCFWKTRKLYRPYLGMGF
ncbi:uncharacterized protein LOC116263112 [Nymphaea colorata]|uniref:uncharacterized protein LOC116263112 n=1 Tax=Nymphaea colorata TaxID=210225 RepID=UPI00129D3BF6|nr:uncharacterized protein LOC116263112 [Nymphaea colorata]